MTDLASILASMTGAKDSGKGKRQLTLRGAECNDRTWKNPVASMVCKPHAYIGCLEGSIPKTVGGVLGAAR